jgi:beta-N-acetylhexosaminidase
VKYSSASVSESNQEKSLKVSYSNLSLEEKVAQLFMLGYEGRDPGLGKNSFLEKFLKLGLGGIIFFRDNFEPKPGEARQKDGSDCLSAKDLKALLRQLKESIPQHCLPPLMGIDQEGGQVERLPHTIFPTAVTPQALALTQHPEFMVKSVIGEMALRLSDLGFNLNFAPTLDVNLNPLNPIIGVRSFGSDPKQVGDLGLVATAAYQNVGIVPVGKHFPGHGNGTVDSHEDLPTLEFSEAELDPFQRAIDAGIPAMLIAHGFYPALQKTVDEYELPSSASPAVIQKLLRKRCGFKGVLMSDDMCMGAITKHRTPEQAAIETLKAGVDVLLYRTSNQSEWAIYEAVLDAFRSGEIPMGRLEESLERIASLKNHYLTSSENQLLNTEKADIDWDKRTCEALADTWAKATFTEQKNLSEESESLQLSKNSSIVLIHPNRSILGNYAWDVATSPELDQLFRGSCYTQIHNLSYPHNAAETALNQIESLAVNSVDTIVFVAFNAVRFAQQKTLAEAIRNRYPQAKLLLISIGSPNDEQAISNPNAHWTLCSYRPASMRAIVTKLRELQEKFIK